jgi:hypothetical protein
MVWHPVDKHSSCDHTAVYAPAAVNHCRCCGRVRIVITTLPLFHREVVTSFKVRGLPQMAICLLWGLLYLFDRHVPNSPVMLSHC